MTNEFQGKTLTEAISKSLHGELETRQLRKAQYSENKNILSGLPSIEEIVDYVLQQAGVSDPVDRDMARHYLLGNGSGRRLRDFGILQAVQAHAETVALGRFRNQILDKAIEAARMGRSRFDDDFERPYDFLPVQYSLGDATLKGFFDGDVYMLEDRIGAKGDAAIEFYDVYKDPLRVEQTLNGVLAKLGAGPHALDLPDITGTRYEITDRWDIHIDILQP